MTRRIKKGWMNLRVTKIKKENHNTSTFHLVDAEEGGRQFDFTAGQYLSFRFDHVGDKPEVRSYTLSSSPHEQDDFSFTVKAVEGGFVSRHMVGKIHEGDILRARGPMGKFCYNPDTDKKHLMMVAAGSGVTPFISILKEHSPFLGKEGHPDKLTLLVSFKTQKDLICWDELQEMNKIDGVDIYTSLTQEKTEGFWQGRIRPELIDKAAGSQYEGTTFMTCGPDGMMESFVGYAKGQGVDDSDVKRESFS